MTRPLLTPERVAALRTEAKEWVRKSHGSLAMLLREVLDAYEESERRRGRLREAIERNLAQVGEPGRMYPAARALRAALEEDDRDGA